MFEHRRRASRVKSKLNIHNVPPYRVTFPQNCQMNKSRLCIDIDQSKIAETGREEEKSKHVQSTKKRKNKREEKRRREGV